MTPRRGANRPSSLPLRALWIAAALLIVLLFWRATRTPEAPRLTVTFLDVGQGDAAVIETPGGKTVLIDTGGIIESHSGAAHHEEIDDLGRRVVLPFLQSRGINHIDAILLTHPHADHIGGAATLLTRLPVQTLMDNGAVNDTPVVTHLLTVAHTQQVTLRPARARQELDFGDGVTAQVLAPTPAETRGPINDASIVLRLRYGRIRFLFTGDAEAGEETDILARYPDRDALTADVLKVGHHGSRTSTTPAFLARVRPRVAIVSVGKYNRYGHPNRDVLTRLAVSGARVFRTDQSGAVICETDGVTLSVQPTVP